MADQAPASKRKSDGHKHVGDTGMEVCCFFICILRCHILCTLKSRWDDSHGHWSFDMQLRSLYELAALAELFNVNGDQDETSDESHVSPPFHFYTYLPTVSFRPL